MFPDDVERGGAADEEKRRGSDGAKKRQEDLLGGFLRDADVRVVRVRGHHCIVYDENNNTPILENYVWGNFVKTATQKRAHDTRRTTTKLLLARPRLRRILLRDQFFARVRRPLETLLPKR